MRRPVRDERWIDPEGNVWQVEMVAKWRTDSREPTEKELKKGRPRRPIAVGPYTVAFYLMRNTDGVELKVSPLEMESWSRDAEDPLEGRRVSLSDEIRNGAHMIVAPAPGMNPVCPVRKGERYHLTCGVIIIDKISRKLLQGRAEWHIEFIRLMKDRDYFLRSVVPGAKPDEIVRDPTAEEIQRARIDGNYKHTAEQDGDELSVVPPEWEDMKVTTRKVAHLNDRDSKRVRADTKRQRTAAKAAIDATLEGLTPENQQRLLARIVSECDAARMEEAA